MPGPVTVALRNASRRVKDAPNILATESGKIVAASVKRHLKQDGQTLAGRRLGVTVKTTGNVAVVTASPRKAIGAWSILEEGTRPHSIAARRSRDSRAMRVGGVWRTGPWNVRGARGHHTFQHAVDEARPLIERETARIMREVVHG